MRANVYEHTFRIDVRHRSERASGPCLLLPADFRNEKLCHAHIYCCLRVAARACASGTRQHATAAGKIT